MGIAIIDSASSQAGLAAGVGARGEFHCTDCGYGITVHRVLPSCPMCRGAEWQPSSTRRAAEGSGAADA
jgi:hypothetical protein